MTIQIDGGAASAGQIQTLRTDMGAAKHHGAAANEAAMVALSSAVVGDMCSRTDTGTVWVLRTGAYSTAGNWQDTGASDGSTTWEEVSTTTYTVVAADFAGKTKYFTHASGCTVTIPQALAQATGAVFKWFQSSGAGQITFQGDGTSTVTSSSGVLVSGGVKTSGYIEHLGSDDFLLVGELSISDVHMIPIMASGMTPSATGGCAALATIASAANQPDISTLDFDSASTEYAQFSIPMPESWDEGTVYFQPIWSHAATTVNFGVCWKLQAVAVGNDDAIAVAYGTQQSSVDTGGTTNDVYVGPSSSAITVAGTPAAGDTVFFRIARVHDDAGDTMAIDARLHGIRLYIGVNAGDDA